MSSLGPASKWAVSTKLNCWHTVSQWPEALNNPQFFPTLKSDAQMPQCLPGITPLPHYIPEHLICFCWLADYGISETPVLLSKLSVTQTCTPPCEAHQGYQHQGRWGTRAFRAEAGQQSGSGNAGHLLFTNRAVEGKGASGVSLDLHEGYFNHLNWSSLWPRFP